MKYKGNDQKQREGRRSLLYWRSCDGSTMESITNHDDFPTQSVKVMWNAGFSPLLRLNFMSEEKLKIGFY